MGQLWFTRDLGARPKPAIARRLETAFSIPDDMTIAVVEYPAVHIVEFFLLKDQSLRYQLVASFVVTSATGVIGFAFAAEFILMVSIAEKKTD